MSDDFAGTIHAIPPLSEIGQIPVPAYYRGHNERIRDFLDGFQTAWELALSIQQDESPPPPVWT